MIIKRRFFKYEIAYEQTAVRPKLSKYNGAFIPKIIVRRKKKIP